jgi:hypothetical protein
MNPIHGYKAKYDYVELTVEQRENHWILRLNDTRHSDSVLHKTEFATAAEARDAALEFAQHHINVTHDDTLLNKTRLTWETY